LRRGLGDVQRKREGVAVGCVFKKGELFVKKVGFEVKVVLESSIEHT